MELFWGELRQRRLCGGFCVWNIQASLDSLDLFQDSKLFHLACIKLIFLDFLF
jgi:hypothetical protein